jgi:hypothetical protein
MTPFTLKLVLPAVQLLGAVLICRRISWRNHPALIGYLGSEAAWQVLALCSFTLPPLAAAVQLAIRTAVVLEVLSFARVRLEPEVRGAAIGIAMAACALAAGATTGLTAQQEMYLFRQYYHLILCATILAAVIRRAQWPMLECGRHKVYRLGMAAWLLVVALAGTFVRGGIGYYLLPYERATWEAVNLATYATLIVIVGTMAVAMACSMPLRKRTAAVISIAERRAA